MHYVMDAMKTKLMADGQAALAAMDPVRLGKVVQDMTDFLQEQVNIDALGARIDSISPPSIPDIQVTP